MGTTHMICSFLSASPFQTCSETCLGCSHKTSPSIGPDLMCILDEDDDEDAIDAVKLNIIQKIDNKNFTLKKLTNLIATQI